MIGSIYPEVILTLPRQRREEIISAIERVRSLIVERLVDQMYMDPFWEERYGNLGKIHARQDVNYHLDNLVTAIRAEMLSSPVSYYHYLQNILVHRGISTRHIYQSLDLLKILLEEALPDEWIEIEPYLEAGYQGLAYENPACQALTEIEQQIAQAATNQLTPPDEGFSSLNDWKQARFQEMLIHLSYLQDAVEKELPQIFEDHTRWSLSYYPTQSVASEIIRREWSLLQEEIRSRLNPEEAHPFQELLDKGLRMVKPVRKEDP